MSKSCNCLVCDRHKKFVDITTKLSSEEKRFLDAIYDDLMNLEYDVSTKKMRKPHMERRHKKSGKIYTITNVNAIDVTNSRDGLPVIIYKNEDGKTFVREKTEFEEKFERIEE